MKGIFRAAAVVVALGAGLTGLACKSSVTSASDCPKAIDALSANIGSTTNAADIDPTLVKTSFSECGGPATWKLSAGVDKIGTQIGQRGDMDGSSLSTSTALDFLCSRFDSGNSTDTCKLR